MLPLTLGARPPHVSSLTVDGATTFSVSPTMYNVKSAGFGAKGDGLTNDSTTIQAAMDAAGVAGGGVVLLPVGTYLINASLKFNYDNVTLTGAGSGTILLAKAALNADIITTTNAGVARHLIGVQSMTLDGNRANQTSGNGIRVFNSLNGVYSNLNILRVHDYALVTDGVSADSYGNRWDHINIAGCGGGVRGVAAEDERFIDIMIHDAVAGYSEMTLAGGQHHIAFCTFAGGGTYDKPTLVLANNAGSRIENNRFDTTRNQAIYTTGNNQIIIGNEFLNSCYYGSHTWAVIQLQSSNNIVVGNRIYMDPVQAATYQYGIYESNARGNNLIADNWIQPGTSTAITPGLLSGSPSIIKNNEGYNPVGSVSTPGFPATTVAVTNSVGVDVFAYITNGANPLTVQVDAVTSLMVIPANQTGTVRIPHGSTFTPTYGGGSPTWKWYGE